MSSLSEYRLTIGFRYDEADGTMSNVFRFETLRQFRTFRYAIDIDREVDEEGGAILFRINGLKAPESSLAGVGSAATEFIDPLLHGSYRITVVGAKEQVDFALRFMPKTMKMERELEQRETIAVLLADEIEVVGS